jgi:hypothetical protein
MKCPYLAMPTGAVCVAKMKTYLPSAKERHDYCRTGDYNRCRFYRAAMQHREAQKDRPVSGVSAS